MKTQESETNTGNAPTHIAYQVKDGAQKSHWTRICAAWAHKDAKGFSLELDSLPINGRITLREASEIKLSGRWGFAHLPRLFFYRQALSSMISYSLLTSERSWIKFDPII